VPSRQSCLDLRLEPSCVNVDECFASLVCVGLTSYFSVEVYQSVL
jgi:hypothetical protein